MKGLFQTRRTNCVAACVASILEVGIEEVPDFNPERWEFELRDWLLSKGFSTINCRFPEEGYDPKLPYGYTLGEVDSLHPVFPGWTHCVVCLDGRVVWCPVNGEEPGTERANVYTMLYSLDFGLMLREGER